MPKGIDNWDWLRAGSYLIVVSEYIEPAEWEWGESSSIEEWLRITQWLKGRDAAGHIAIIRNDQLEDSSNRLIGKC